MTATKELGGYDTCLQVSSANPGHAIFFVKKMSAAP